jgi:alanyl-tRNA synthetase
MKSTEIRKAFVDFFEKKGHTFVKSDNLVPQKDPSLLFTTAGMVQFKPLWIGAPLSYSKAVSVQKCLRAGGKGSDLENVGRTLRHHTFFEMLGNFSFGDYFKKEAIEFAWEFLTDVLKMDTDNLWISVYKDDDEAFDIWNKVIGFPKERIVRLGDKDNFWGPAGPTGACGPSSEIHIDLGEEKGCGEPGCGVGCDCERYLEFWNIVFPQYDQQEDGTRIDLNRRGIDTGMGLERLCYILQGVNSNYETDLFKPIIEALSKITNTDYNENNCHCFHVVADHIRALTFTFSENILPSNEGRGYVLRRILRRAYRFGKKLGINEPFLYKLVPVVVDVMREAYPELLESREHVTNVVKIEEENFEKTLNACEIMLEEIIQASKKDKIIKGADIFKLYDTYGLHLEMIEDIADEQGISLETEVFNGLMAEQKERARGSWQGGKDAMNFEIFNKILSEYGKTEFTGYEKIKDTAKVIVIIKDDKITDKADEGEEVYIVCNKTPFYAESGGQVGDVGNINNDSCNVEVTDTIKVIPEIIAHKVKVNKGFIKTGDIVELTVDKDIRKDIARNHTATHILHNVLREVLGDSVKQAGSYVANDRARFDFTYASAISKQVLDKIESLVNEKILENSEISTEDKSMKEAVDSGAMALFGEKYDDRVRVVCLGEYSKELCGGIHSNRTGDIGIFKIIAQSSVAAGIRRIEAVTGKYAYKYFKAKEEIINELTETLKSSEDRLLDKISGIILELKEKETYINKIKKQDSLGQIDSIINKAVEKNGIRIIAEKTEIDDVSIIKTIVDKIRNDNDDIIIVLASEISGKAVFVAGVSKVLIEKGYKAGDIVAKVSKIAGGGGGGRPDFAQAGGKDISKIEEALEAVVNLV